MKIVKISERAYVDVLTHGGGMATRPRAEQKDFDLTGDEL